LFGKTENENKNLDNWLTEQLSFIKDKSTLKNTTEKIASEFGIFYKTLISYQIPPYVAAILTQNYMLIKLNVMFNIPNIQKGLGDEPVTSQ